MTTLRQVFKIPKLIGRRLSSSGPIRKYDRRSDETGNSINSGLTGGIMKTTIDALMECPGLTERMIASDMHVRPAPDKRAHYSWDIPAFLWEATLKSAKLQAAMIDYLGPRVRLDDLYVKSVMDGLSSISEGWHDDNVGYRVKVFMVFDTEGEPSGTLVVPTERPHLYKVRVADEFARFLITPKTDAREGAVRVSYEKGDCLLFDTNIPHRGDYSSGEGIRYCVIAEFIDRDKSTALRGKAPCGPGQARNPIRIPRLHGVDVSAHPLIDDAILRRDGEGWLYGYL